MKGRLIWDWVRVQLCKAREEQLSDRRVRQLKAEAREAPHKVDPKKATKEFAMSQWDRDGHKSLFFLTMVVRQLYQKLPSLRLTELRDHRLWVNGRPVVISFLFRDHAQFDQAVFQSISSAMGRMHVHNVFPVHDTLHQSITDVLNSAKSHKAWQVYFLSFFFEFSYLTQFETRSSVLKQCTRLWVAKSSLAYYDRL
eukprot:12431513-Karenia_brevis.AAC.4